MRLRIALLLLGAWLALNAARWVVPVVGVRSVDSWRSAAPQTGAGGVSGEERLRARALGAERDRRLLRWLGGLEVAVALAVAVLVVSEPGFALGAKLASGGGAAATLLLVLLAAPALGRRSAELDRVARPVPLERAGAEQALVRTARATLLLEVVRLVLAASASASLLRAREGPSGGDSGPSGRASRPRLEGPVPGLKRR